MSDTDGPQRKIIIVAPRCLPAKGERVLVARKPKFGIAFCIGSTGTVLRRLGLGMLKILLDDGRIANYHCSQLDWGMRLERKPQLKTTFQKEKTHE